MTTRRRLCDNPLPKGGADCPGDATETIRCFVECPGLLHLLPFTLLLFSWSCDCVPSYFVIFYTHNIVFYMIEQIKHAVVFKIMKWDCFHTSYSPFLFHLTRRVANLLIILTVRNGL